MASITVKGREIPLFYSTYEMKLLQEEIAPLAQLSSKIFGQNPEDPKDRSLYGGAEHLENAAKLARILGNAGLEEAGEAPDLTDKKIMRAFKPQELIVDVVNKCVEAMNEGMKSEYPQEEAKGPVDVTLEEMKKKEVKED